MSKRQRRQRDKQRRHQSLLPTKRQLSVAGGLALGASLVTGATAQADTFNVNATDDNGDFACDSDCTLRDAINDSNDNNNDPTVDVITFAAGLSGTIQLDANDLALYVLEPVDIQGPGAGVITVEEYTQYGTYVFYLDTGGDPVTISGLTITGGDNYGGGVQYGSGNGGGIESINAVLTVNNSVITGNSTSGDGGGVFGRYENTTLNNTQVTGNSSYYYLIGGSDGGGVAQRYDSLTLNNSVVSYNDNGFYPSCGFYCGDDGGGIYSYDAPVYVNSSAIYGNYGHFAGGGIYGYLDPVTIQNSVLSDNAASEDGGGAYQYENKLTIGSSTVSGNATFNDDGGGVHSHYSSIEIRNSTFSDNYAYSDGGGIYFNDHFDPSTIVSSTLSGNQAGDDSGALRIDDTNGYPFSIVDTTIAGNTAADIAGGVQLNGGSPNPLLQNTIVAGNSAGTSPDLDGTFDAAFSLIQNTSGAALTETVAGSNLLGVDPQLGALAFNGGPTQTRALASTSPAVDKGSSALGADQRGSVRPSDFPAIANSAAAGANGADIGAFELQVPAPAAVTAKCKGKTATIVGTAGANTLTGTSGRDVIAALGGNDRVIARGGNDLICLGGGKDRAKGGGGKDKEFGGAKKDKLSGNGGRDKLVGQGGADTLKGGGARDVLKGGAKRDVLIGGPGDDVLKGGGGIDVLVGGAGTDRVRQ